jgi:hypothetical protein
VNKVIGYLDKPLEKLYAIVCEESGLRGDSGVLNLKWKHIEKDYNHTIGPIWLDLGPEFRQNSKHSGYTFIGTRARELINGLVESKKILTEPETPLFPYTYNSIVKIVTRAKGKVRPRIGRNVEPIHGFRKFYENSLISANVPERIIDIMFGRFKTQDAKAYTARRREELLPYYEQAYSHLDYMNNMPEQTQELLTNQTRFQDIINQQNTRIQRLEAQRQFVRDIGDRDKLTQALALLPDEQVDRLVFESTLLFYDKLKKIRAAENIQPLPTTKTISAEAQS